MRRWIWKTLNIIQTLIGLCAALTVWAYFKIFVKTPDKASEKIETAIRRIIQFELNVIIKCCFYLRNFGLKNFKPVHRLINFMTGVYNILNDFIWEKEKFYYPTSPEDIYEKNKNARSRPYNELIVKHFMHNQIFNTERSFNQDNQSNKEQGGGGDKQ